LPGAVAVLPVVPAPALAEKSSSDIADRGGVCGTLGTLWRTGGTGGTGKGAERATRDCWWMRVSVRVRVRICGDGELSRRGGLRRETEAIPRADNRCDSKTWQPQAPDCFSIAFSPHCS
jgi:hypothetical protein